jgi:hypothetical protein
LAGIVRPLARLKAEQLPARSSTRFADSTYPVTQKLAVELVDALGLTNEALICVGRTLDVARKLLAASLLDQKLRTFVFDQLSWLCGARRSWEARQSIQNGDFQAALDLILPSELFQLGRRYSLNQSEDQSSDGPVEFDLPWFFENSTEFVCSTKSLVDELGFPTTTFFGVDLLLVDHLSSIEAATTFNSPHRAAERSCELKFYMADLFWRMGLPSTLFKPVCDKILDRILPKVSQVDREDWRAVTQQLQTVTEDDVVEVISELFEE